MKMRHLRILLRLGLGLCLVLGLSSQATSQNVQVNQVDNNTGTVDNSTSQSETSHAVFRSTIVVGYNNSKQYATDGLSGLTSMTGFAFSTDGGITFTDAGFLAPPPGYVNWGDPSLAVDRDGNFYFATLTAADLMTVAVAKSASISPTVTFGTPVVINGLASFFPSADKEWIAVDTSGGPFDGRVYVAWTEFRSCGFAFCPDTKILFTHSTSTSPLVFATPIVISSSDSLQLNQGAMVVVAPTGEVYVAWGEFFTSQEMAPCGGTRMTGEVIHLRASIDGGVTFHNPDPNDPASDKTLASPTPSADCLDTGTTSSRTRGFPYIAVDHARIGQSRGYIYIVFQADPDGPGPDRSDVFFTRSTDGGATWSAPRSINAAPAVTLNPDGTTNDNWQPSISVSLTNGHIKVTYYDRRDDPANTNLALYEAVSTDFGATWFNRRVSTATFSPALAYDPLSRSSYMGDYNFASQDKSNFHLTWGDFRNTCSPPGGAPNPCSPTGRSDQDAFYSREILLSGPDLFITPWGYITGVGPLWQSPDVFVVDASGNRVNAARGQHNQLRAHVRNLGDASASGVVIRFRYAPLFVGLSPDAFKDIGAVTLDFGAQQDPTGSSDKVAAVDWDLTNLNDDNGGLWPMPIGAFNHFCVKVTVEFPGDVNQGNNNAQTNFFDALTITPLPVRFIVGNPFDRTVKAQLILEPIANGFRADLKEFPVGFGQEFTLKRRETRVATVIFFPPGNIDTKPPQKDVVAQVALKIGRELVGGFSLRIAQGAKPHQERTFTADFDRVFKAILIALRERQEPVALADQGKGLINTKSVIVNGERLSQIVESNVIKFPGQQSGRYLLSFDIVRLTGKGARVKVTALIILNTEAQNPVGGQPLRSNGALETEHLDAIARILAGGT